MSRARVSHSHARKWLKSSQTNNILATRLAQLTRINHTAICSLKCPLCGSSYHSISAQLRRVLYSLPVQAANPSPQTASRLEASPLTTLFLSRRTLRLCSDVRCDKTRRVAYPEKIVRSWFLLRRVTIPLHKKNSLKTDPGARFCRPSEPRKRWKKKSFFFRMISWAENGFWCKKQEKSHEVKRRSKDERKARYHSIKESSKCIQVSVHKAIAMCLSVCHFGFLFSFGSKKKLFFFIKKNGKKEIIQLSKSFRVVKTSSEKSFG